MGNMVNISHYNKRSKRVSQQFKHNLSAYDVYRLFEVFNKQIENAAEKDLRKPMGLYEVTGDLEINPHSKADKHKKETKVLYKLNYNSSVKSINQINKELHILIENVLKK
jgi:hypothetical protein